MACLQRLQRMSRIKQCKKRRFALLSVFFSKKERITLIKVSFPRSTFSILQLVRWHKLADFIFHQSDTAENVCTLILRQMGGWVFREMNRGNTTGTSPEYDLPRLTRYVFRCYIHRHWEFFLIIIDFNMHIYFHYKIGILQLVRRA